MERCSDRLGLRLKCRDEVSYHAFSAGNTSSYIVELSIDSVTSGPGTDTARVGSTSVQDPSFGYLGQACSHWSMTYTMIPSEGTWLIDKAVPAPGSPTGAIREVARHWTAVSLVCSPRARRWAADHRMDPSPGVP